MKRLCLALLGAGLALVGFVAQASAQTIEVGATASKLVAPTCPPGVSASNCTIILAQKTAYVTHSDGVANPTTIRQSGAIVGFTVGASNLSSNAKTRAGYVAHLNATYGGAPSVRLTVLRPVGAPSAMRWQVAAQTQPFSLLPYLGTVAQIPLQSSLPVTRGEVLALTSPTWAPVLDIDLSTSKFTYRQSHSTGCNAGSMPDYALLRIGLMARYGCAYTGTRIEYTATEITWPGVTAAAATARAQAAHTAGVAAAPRPAPTAARTAHTGGVSPLVRPRRHTQHRVHPRLHRRAHHQRHHAHRR